LKTNKVVLECHQRLKTLFEKAFPQITVHGTREDLEVTWSPEGIDYRLSIGSLGKFYRNSREDFPGTPYLKTDSLPKGKKFRVGISWMGGGPKRGRVMKRSVPLSWWKPILNIPNVEFVSLQYTDSKEDLDIMQALGYDIKRMDEYIKHNDYYESAKLVASCDLVVTVCTSVVHLAGALGIPCWVMTPKWPAWRYQNTGGMPWYKSVRLYRSPDTEQEAWKPVIGKIGLDLDDLVNAMAQRVA
jgi:ADP-heptose:LPS heptosyltransferase